MPGQTPIRRNSVLMGTLCLAHAWADAEAWAREACSAAPGLRVLRLTVEGHRAAVLWTVEVGE